MVMRPWRTGLVFGALLGLWHAAWATLVAIGAAQPLADFILRIHFIDLPFKIAPFDLATAAVLVVVTSAVGWLGGVVLALLWNRLHKAR
jgi:ABC-type lipoprotein release transport system permease subunit